MCSKNMKNGYQKRKANIYYKYFPVSIVAFKIIIYNKLYNYVYNYYFSHAHIYTNIVNHLYYTIR